MVSPPKVAIKKNVTTAVKLPVQLRSGYHVNSNTPSDEYLIPLKLTWTATPLEVETITYPVPKKEKYTFSEKPLSVFSGDFDIVTRFKAPAGASPGMQVISGKLRYQACTDKECFPPRTVEVRLPVDIIN
ncbi:MAG: hypothetical protein HY820_24835 [Acidobacteria bacterium]|nr:hypothetical protein [Acidobacteriota bacterium]